MESTEKPSETERVKLYLRSFKEVLEEFLNPLTILNKMPDFNKEVGRKIREAADNPQKQVELFLEELENSANSATLQCFLDALNHSDEQRFIYQYLTGELTDKEYDKFIQQLKEMPQKKKLFDLLMPQLEVINARHCIAALGPWLSTGERNVLEAKCQNCGNTFTIWWIVSFIIRKEPSWIKEFYRHVKRHNYSNPEEGTLANLLSTYFQLDEISVGDDDEITPALEVEYLGTHSSTKDKIDNPGNEEGALSMSYSEKGVELDDESASNNLETDVASSTSFSTTNTSSADGDSASSPKKSIKLRSYQEELSKLALEGQNVIICAPPGSGKTLVASHIIRNHLEKHGNDQKKVLFFTPGGALAQQQCTRLQEHLPADYTVDFRCGRTETSSLLEMMNTDVVVLTPQMLVNEFRSKDKLKAFKGMNEFGLLIFDECHHCHKGHPYNNLMRNYFSLTNESDTDVKLPQVVGLTATPGIGKNPRTVLTHMRELCANLDAVDGFVTVRDEKNKEELYKHIPRPEKQTIRLVSRTGNAFHMKLLQFFEQIKAQMRETGEYSVASLYDENYDRSSKKFQTWCDQLKNEIAEAQLPTARDAYTCVEYLEKCEKAIDFYMMLRPKDAADHLDNFVTGIDEKKLTERERILYEIARDVKKELVEMCSNPEFENPNLNGIENLIVRRFRTEPNSKAMLMVETREYAIKLQEWTKESEALRFLNAEVFMGVANKTGVSGLTATEQRNILMRFGHGECKMLVNTPESAGEGLDIPDCNLVINYDFLQNEISMIQTTGRVRDKDGEMYSIASKKTERYDNFNAIKAILMEEAVEELQNEISRDKSAFRSQLLRIQREAQLKHNAEVLALLCKRRNFIENEYLIKCKKCSKDLCSSFDLRVAMGGHHINVTREFKDKYERKEHARKKKRAMGIDWTKKYKMHCKECHAELGIEAMWKQHIILPLLKASSIRIVSTTHEKVRNQTPKHWAQAPFKPEEVDLDDIESELDHLVEPDYLMETE